MCVLIDTEKCDIAHILGCITLEVHGGIEKWKLEPSEIYPIFLEGEFAEGKLGRHHPLQIWGQRE